MISAIIFQIVVPLLLLVYFIRGTKTALSMIARAVVVIGVMLAIRSLSPFLLLPWYTFYLYLGILCITVLLAVFFRSQIVLSPRRRAAAVLRIDMIIVLIVVNLNIFTLLGQAPDYSNIVTLESPVLGRSVYVKNGGTHSLMNAHIPPLWNPSNWRNSGPRPSSFYGVDLVLINDDGRPSEAWFPHNEFDYVGYNEIIYSPCSGVVLEVGPDRSDAGGTSSDLGQIVIECGSFEVVLGHLLARSLTLRPGARIVQGQMLGTLGALDISAPPYLHLHVHRREIQTNGAVEVIPVQVRIDDNFLARGDIAP